MPAIQPAVLKQQAVLLAEHFSDPSAYIRSMHHLLDYYADHTRHRSTSGKAAQVLPAYRVHPPVLRALVHELIPWAAEDPFQGLALCDALWNVPYVEFKQMAALLLGQVPVEDPNQIVERIISWLTPDLESSIVKFLLEQSFKKLHAEYPQAMERMIQEWLQNKDPFFKQLGLHALLPLILQPENENLPAYYRMVQPLICEIPTGLRPDILDIVTALAQRSPAETAFYLRQTLKLPESQDTAWVIRQSISSFSSDDQKSLREAVRPSIHRD